MCNSISISSGDLLKDSAPKYHYFKLHSKFSVMEALITNDTLNKMWKTKSSENKEKTN